MKDKFTFGTILGMRRKGVVIHLIMFSQLFCLVIFGQQEAQFTQYNDNMILFNSAYAGRKECMNISAVGRFQWLGFDGAPITQAFSIHSPLKYKSVGLGLSFLNDKVGPLSTSSIKTSFSYSLRFGDKSVLSFGLNGNLNFVSIPLNQLTVIDENDPVFSSTLNNLFLPDFGGGVFYRTDQFYVGCSLPGILESNLKPGQIGFEDLRHYYLSVGGYLNLNRRLKLRPSVLIKMVENAPMALDGSLAVIVYDKIWLGANFRLKESAGGMIQINIANHFKLGYSFDVSTGQLVHYNYGTHEVLLMYDIFNKKRKIESTKRFYF